MIETAKVEAFNQTLKCKGVTVVCAESMTAGLLASTIASAPWAASVLKGAIVTYDENLKMNLLGVNPLTLAEHTAESQETTDAMCLGLKKLYPEATVHVAVTGVASAPDPDADYTVDKAVGQIYISILYNKKLERLATVLQPTGDDERNSIRCQTVELILEKIAKLIKT